MKLSFKCLPVGDLPYETNELATKLTVKLFENVPFLANMPNASEDESVINRSVSNLPGVKIKDKKIIFKEGPQYKPLLVAMDAAFNNPSAESLEPYKFDTFFLPKYFQILKRIKPAETVVNLTGPFTLSQKLVAKDGVQISFVEPGVTEIKQEDLLKHIEYCGRTCYNSLDKITDTSAEKFVRNLVARGHGSVLEHGTVYFLFPREFLPKDTPDGKIQHSPYSFSVPKDEYSYYLTTNFRVVAEAFDMDFDRAYNYILMNGMDCTEHQRRRTFKIVCDRGIANEAVRHRAFSFSQASQRYINSTKAGFEFVKPYWWMDSFEGATLTERVTQMLFEQECRNCSTSYQALIVAGIFGGFGVFLMRQYFLGFSKELEEASRLDGCNCFQTFYKVALPCALPALAVLSIFTFVTSWNSFMWPLIVTNTENMRTLAVGLTVFKGSFREITLWGELMACSCICSVPVILIFITGQKYLINNPMSGALKE